ncbi:MAG: mechanosensitive ion channel [Gammaproteobacteria bacterium]|nr:mechanosensitive ion channel [Gammaproteobacteria bacterium]MCY4211074.1 mechanosensitive ion channel [Gammaproteobacteria bacterium]MCY4281343.1 mechanosensitive ion channel [Gammaproteobacteria bacterium]MCY4338267.1 mechanosensitive ion channel [Gammaproteobacteria bacterium]
MQQQYSSWKELLTNSFDQFVSTFMAYLPNLFVAAVLMATGLLVAALSRSLIMRLGQWLERFAQRTGISSYYLRVRWPITRIVATIIYWLVIIFFVTAAAKSLGLPGIAEWLNKLIEYSPSILVAALVIWAGFVIGDFTRENLATRLGGARIQQAQQLGNAARLLVIMLTIIIGLGQLGVEVGLLAQLLVIVVSAVMLALALAFGIGAGTMVANIIALRNLGRHYQKGQRVRLGELEGEIVELSRTAVILDTDTGQAAIPAKVFQEQTCILLTEED